MVVKGPFISKPIGHKSTFFLDELLDFKKNDIFILMMEHQKELTEAELLHHLKLSIDPKDLEEYQQLVAIFKGSEISPEDHERLIQLSDLVEITHAMRMKHVVALAKLRNISLEEILQEAGTSSIAHI